MEKYKKLSDFDIENIKNKIKYKSISKEEKIEKLKRKLHLTYKQASWLIDTKEREDLVEKLMQIENDEDECAKSKIPCLIHIFKDEFQTFIYGGILCIIIAITLIFFPYNRPGQSVALRIGLFIPVGLGCMVYGLTKYKFLIKLKKKYESSNLIEKKLKILDVKLLNLDPNYRNETKKKVIGIKFLVEIDNDEVYLIYPTVHFRKYLKGERGSFNLENELKKNINKNIEHKILYYDKARIIKKIDFNIDNFIKDYLERR